MAPDQVKYTIDQRSSAKVAEFTQGDAGAQMTFAIGVATWTTQGTLTGDFDGKQWNAAAQNAPSGVCKISWSKTGSSYCGLHCEIDAS